MIIGVDIRVLGSRQRTGIQEYTENLLAALLPLDPSIQYKFFYTSYRRWLPDYAWLQAPNSQVYRFQYPNNLLFYTSRLLNRPYVDRLMGGVDVFFSPHFFITALSLQVRRVTTFHDLSFERFPEFFSKKQWLWHRFVNPAWQARFSQKIISVSDSTKHDLAELYGIDAARISTVYSGVHRDFRPLPDELVRSFRERKQLPRRYIFSIGTLEPRKNIAGLIKAFTALQTLPGLEDLHLVIAGAKGWINSRVLESVKKLSNSSIHLHDYINSHERAWYYNGAELFVYPSFFEGFGFPPLEAMACGVPVITSSTSSLPEVVGSAGLLVNPYSVSDLVTAMRSMLTEPELREHYIQRGLTRAAQFSWEKTARQTLDILKRA